MKEPTEAQIREFWEWCGFEWWSIHRQGDLTDDARWEPLSGVEILINDDRGDMPYQRILKGNKWESAPPIDLNNLFKYAVEGKLKELGYHVTYSVDYDPEMIERGRPLKHYWNILRGSHQLMGQGEGKDPALALFWAIWEARK